MYVLPQEIEVWYIIPALRKEFSRILIEKYDFTYEKVGEILGISKSAVCQYISKKRASKFKLSDKIKHEIEKSADKIYKNNKIVLSEIQKVLVLMRKKKYCCEACKKYNSGVLGLCPCNLK